MVSEWKRNADDHPFPRDCRIVDPCAGYRIALAKPDRRLKDALIESLILRIALTTPAALNACAADVQDLCGS